MYWIQIPVACNNKNREFIWYTIMFPWIILVYASNYSSEAKAYLETTLSYIKIKKQI